MQRGLWGVFFCFGTKEGWSWWIQRLDFSISCLFKMMEGGFQWTFLGVYGPV